MKQNLILTVAGLLTTAAFGQQTFSTSETVNTVIPDNNASGLASGVTLSGLSDPIGSVTVTLDITGGFNGDLYAYLVGPSGDFAVLLNRVGVSDSSASGYSNTGFEVTLSDTAANSIQYYQNDSPGYNGSGQLTGTWQPEGVNIDPQSAAADFSGAGQTALLSSFAGTDANGQWVLYVADLSAGGQSTLTSWTLNIITVPEPSEGALLGGGLLGLIMCWRKRSSYIPNRKRCNKTGSII
jgi:subtilisin-like proprotein convertase family protein